MTEKNELNPKRIEEIFSTLNISARVVHVTRGHGITRFELKLDNYTTIEDIHHLERSISKELDALSVRMEIPLSGYHLAALEVATSEYRDYSVSLREILDSEIMHKSESSLTFALGRDIAGTPIVYELAKMPHILIAGQAGSGIIECIDAIINSFLLRTSSERVKLIMTNPQIVELQRYNCIPHLLIPIVNNPYKAIAVLAWAVAEMKRRNHKFRELFASDLDDYNAIIEPFKKPMSRIVIIISELADLLLVDSKNIVKEYISHLGWEARIAGIHLVVVTKRPAIDVITNTITVNLPSRIAFKTPSSVESRTILDRAGAEHLLNWGDMLYLPYRSLAPIRVRSCSLSNEEINSNIAYAQKTNAVSYDLNIIKDIESSCAKIEEISRMDMYTETMVPEMNYEELFEAAVACAISNGQITRTILQRTLRIGYAMAGRLADELAEKGIVSKKDSEGIQRCLIIKKD